MRDKEGSEQLSLSLRFRFHNTVRVEQQGTYDSSLCRARLFQHRGDISHLLQPVHCGQLLCNLCVTDAILIARITISAPKLL